MDFDHHDMTLFVESARIGDIPVEGQMLLGGFRDPPHAQLKARGEFQVTPPALHSLSRQGGLENLLTLDGGGPGTFRVVKAGGQPDFRIALDWDLTHLSVAGPGGVGKATGLPGHLSLTADMSPSGATRLSAMALHAGDVECVGSGHLDDAGRLDWIKLPRFRYGETRGAIALEGRAAGGHELRLGLDVLDLTPWLPAGNDSDADTEPATETDQQEQASSATAPEVLDRPPLDLQVEARQVRLARGVTADALDLALERRSPGSRWRLARLSLEHQRMISPPVEPLRPAQGEETPSSATVVSAGQGSAVAEAASPATTPPQPVQQPLLQAQGHLDWPGGWKRGAYDGRLDLTLENAGVLLRGLGIHDGMEGGHGRIDLQLQGVIPDGETWLPHLSGQGEITLHDGVVTRFKILSTLLALLSLGDIPDLLAGERPDLAGEGYYYDDIAGRFTLDHGVLTTPGVQFSGPAMTLMFSGRALLPQKQLDLLAGVRPLQSLDRVINLIPVLRDLLSGSRKTLVETQFTLRGPWKDPEVHILPVSSLAPGVVRDLLSLPGRMLERSGADNATQASPETQPAPREGEFTPVPLQGAIEE
ncbi:MAG: AsmA-like C-terminal domain-containing protein [Magnetococcus sp. WYHC-3]